MRKYRQFIVTPAVLLSMTVPVLAKTSAAANPPAEDPIGMGIGWVLMVGMLVALAFAVWRLATYWEDVADILAGEATATALIRHWAVPALAVVGIAISMYLTYIETTRATAVCGPIGNCNMVQASPYARLFGIPMGVLGVINYAAVLAFWAGTRAKHLQIAAWSTVLMLALTLFGVLFSIYLTYVELRLIFAVCIYCITSAVITTALMLMALLATTALPLEEDAAL